MMWYDPLVKIYRDHLEKEHHHNEYGPEEVRFLEEHLHYESFKHADEESFRCCFVDCKWSQHFTVNFDLLTKNQEESE